VNTGRATRNVNVVDHQFDIAGATHELDHETDDESHAPEDREADGTTPLGGPQHMLQDVDDKEVERAHDPACESRDEHESDDPRFHPYEEAVEYSQDTSTKSSQHEYIVLRSIPMAGRQLSDADYRRLLEFRTELRRFLHWSEEEAKREGLTTAQHQLLLAVRGHPGPQPPTVGDVAEALLLRHHSATGLVDRTVQAGYLCRTRDHADQRVVRLAVTRAGANKLARLSQRHLEELNRLRQGVL